MRAVLGSGGKRLTHKGPTSGDCHEDAQRASPNSAGRCSTAQRGKPTTASLKGLAEKPRCTTKRLEDALQLARDAQASLPKSVTPSQEGQHPSHLALNMAPRVDALSLSLPSLVPPPLRGLHREPPEEAGAGHSIARQCRSIGRMRRRDEASGPARHSARTPCSMEKEATRLAIQRLLQPSLALLPAKTSCTFVTRPRRGGPGRALERR